MTFEASLLGGGLNVASLTVANENVVLIRHCVQLDRDRGQWIIWSFFWKAREANAIFVLLKIDVFA